MELSVTPSNNEFVGVIRIVYSTDSQISTQTLFEGFPTLVLLSCPLPCPFQLPQSIWTWIKFLC